VASDRQTDRQRTQRTAITKSPIIWSQRQSQIVCQKYAMARSNYRNTRVRHNLYLHHLSSANVWNDDGFNNVETRGSNDVRHDIRPPGNPHHQQDTTRHGKMRQIQYIYLYINSYSVSCFVSYILLAFYLYFLCNIVTLCECHGEIKCYLLTTYLLTYI